jgi:hypothetical protein
MLTFRKKANHTGLLFFGFQWIPAKTQAQLLYFGYKNQASTLQQGN